MECAVITTYRCNARCQMCNIWQNPTHRDEEFSPEILEKLPGGMKRLNITGGEPMLRDDILEIVRILDQKSDRLEISTNGYFTNRIVEVCEHFPNTTVRVSVEGLPTLSDELRGIKNGFDHALRTILRLKEMDIRDIGFGVVVSDRNCADLMDLYTLSAAMDLEFASAAMHNSFYFHKDDNRIEDVDSVATEVTTFIHALLTSKRSNWRMRIKDWGRAYLNLGLLRYVRGQTRPLPCGAATDSFFVSPYGEILACNGSAQPWVMGDLTTDTFEEIWHSERAQQVRRKARECARNCWMAGTAVPAMRNAVWIPAWWILRNKIRLMMGKDIVFS